MTRETFDWWKEQLLANQDKIIVSAHHNVLRHATTRSSYGGGEGFHGKTGDFGGASYLYFTIENDDPEDFEYTTSTSDHPGPFEVFLEEFQEEHGKPAIDLWIGGHTHSYPGEVYEGRGITEERWGVTFLQVAALTHHNTARVPMSRLLSFTGGSASLEIGLYVHLAPYYSHIPADYLAQQGIELWAPETPEGVSPATAGTSRRRARSRCATQLSRHQRTPGQRSDTVNRGSRIPGDSLTEDGEEESG